MASSVGAKLVTLNDRGEGSLFNGLAHQSSEFDTFEASDSTLAAILYTSGYLRIVGRVKELIISGGFNIYPK